MKFLSQLFPELINMLLNKIHIFLQDILLVLGVINKNKVYNSNDNFLFI